MNLQGHDDRSVLQAGLDAKGANNPDTKLRETEKTVKEAVEKREQMKANLEQEYLRNKEPSREFINCFAEKYDVQLPNDVLFDSDALMERWMNM